MAQNRAFLLWIPVLEVAVPTEFGQSERMSVVVSPLWGFVLLLLASALPNVDRPRSRPDASWPATDTLRGTASDDVLRGSPGSDLLDGGAGDDRLSGREGDDLLRGGDGRDVLEGGQGSDVLEGGGGDDVLDGGDDRDWLFGEAGADRLIGGEGPDVLDGGPGLDELDGGPGDDLMDGGEGDDGLKGGEGNDVLDGGDGLDVLDGGAGNDNLDGGDENDILLGGAGADTLQGGDGDDILEGGVDADVLLGGDGEDVLRGGGGNDVLGGRDGNDFVDGGLGDDFLNGGDGNDVLVGGGGADTVFGFNGDDRMRGGGGDDLIRGGAGEDVLDGDEGDDELMGGTGTDVIAAGDGNDVIVLRAGDVDSARVETIDGGTNADTARAEADSLVLDGFLPSDVHVADAGQQGWRITDPVTGGTYAVTRVEHIVYVHVFAHLSAGGSSILHLVNPSATQAVSGRVEFTGAGGDSLSAVVQGSAGSTHAVTLPPLGSVELPIEAPERDGAVRVLADQPLAGVLRTQLPGNTRGALSSSGLLDAFKVPVRIHRQEGATSGFAVANARVATTLKVTLYTAAGNEVEAREVDVPSRGQSAVFAHDLFQRYATFDGAMLVEGGPVSATALQVAPRADPTAAGVVPVVPRAPRGPFRFAHLANGDGFATEIVLVGLPPDSGKRGKVAFFDEAGKPLSLDLVGLGPVEEVSFAVAPGGAVAFATNGRGPLVHGSALVTLGSGQVAGVARLTLPRLGRLDVAAGPVVGGFAVPARRHAAGGLTTLVAMSAGETPVTVELALHDAAGARLRRGDARVRLPANGHTAVSLERLFPRADTDAFHGALVAKVEGGTIAVTVLELGSSAGEAVALPIIARR